MALPMKKVAMKKSSPMKKSSAMKKAMKATMKRAVMKKKVSKIAKGKYAKAAVFNGRKEKAQGGLVKSSIIKNKNGRYVSKQASAARKKN